jgi:tetratricopeptide (TPR) repeat protein
MSRATRKLEKRYETLGAQAEELISRGQHDDALACLEGTLTVLGELAAADPADARPQVSRALVLRRISNLLQATEYFERAASVLNERVQVCRELAGRYGLDIRRELADVDAMGGALTARRGSGAAAVVLLDSALAAYLPLLGETSDEPDDAAGLASEFSLALINQASVLMAYGDPALAGAAADNAFRFYVGQYDQPGWNAAVMGKIARAASNLLARVGRLDDAVSADECLVIATREAAQASGSAADRTRLASALAVRGLHLEATGMGEAAVECLAESRRLDPGATTAEIEGWDRAQSEAPPLTLSAALSTAAERLGDHVLAGLPACLTSAPDPRTFRISRLCQPERLPEYAATLAGISIELLPVAVREGLRIGLEAHYLFAVGQRENPAGDDQMLTRGIPWVRLNLECCRVLVTESEQPSGIPLALDLAASNVDTIDAILDAMEEERTPDRAESARLLHDCLTEHAQLVDAHGDRELAQILQRKADALGGRIR